MCGSCHDNFNEFPPRFFGGPSGDYFIIADMISAEWLEYRIVSIALGDAGPGTLIITASDIEFPETYPWDGTVTFTDTATPNGIIYRMSATTSPPIVPTWVRIVGPQRRLLARIDVPANTSMFVTVQFRAKVLKTIPSPFVTVHPEHQEQYHLERAQRVKDAVLGKEGETIEYGTRPAKGRTVRELVTGKVAGLDATGGTRQGKS
jgi:hypothetical protein